MAELEDAESGDVGRARAWMGRALLAPRDPSWTADGLVSGKWLPVSPVTGRLDAFEWKVPVSDVEPTAVIAAPPPSMVQPAQLEPAPVTAPAVEAIEPEPAAEEKAEIVVPANPEPVNPEPVKPADTVIPLIQPPDDPGPEPDKDESLGEAPQESWKRLRGLFK
jgi:HemY protein